MSGKVGGAQQRPPGKDKGKPPVGRVAAVPAVEDKLPDPGNAGKKIGVFHKAGILGPGLLQKILGNMQLGARFKLPGGVGVHPQALSRREVEDALSQQSVLALAAVVEELLQ